MNIGFQRLAVWTGILSGFDAMVRKSHLLRAGRNFATITEGWPKSWHKVSENLDVVCRNLWNS